MNIRLRPILAMIALAAACFAAGRYSSPASPKGDGGAPAPAPGSSGGPTASAGSADASRQARDGQTIGDRDPAPDEAHWKDLAKQGPGIGRNNALATLLEKMAATEPAKAMGLANQEKNLLLRHTLDMAVLKGWASVSPGDAAAAALGLPDHEEQNAGLDAVFAEAVAVGPDGALSLGKNLVQQRPDRAIELGNKMVDALCGAGQFDAAAQFAASGTGPEQGAWTGNVFSNWSQVQPELAAQAALAIADPDTRNTALHGVVGGWAQADPAGLTQFLGTLPAGGDRPAMLTQSLGAWVKEDPVAASAWINNNGGLGSDVDQGVASVATANYLKPDVAITWADSITDPTLRSQTAASVVSDWVHTDVGAARAYVQSTTNLLPEDRKRLTELLAAFQNN